MASTNLGKILFTPKGAYNPLTSYVKFDVIGFEGGTFLVLKDVKGVSPVEGEYYQLMASRGDVGPAPSDTDIKRVVEETSFETLTTDAKKLVEAINEVKGKVPDIETKTYETLETEEKTLIGAINELNGKIQDILDKLSTT